MKKIVALALSMIMVLSLCTVAFAYKEGDKLYDSLTDGKGNTYTYHAASTNYKAGSTDNKVATLEITDAEDKTNVGKFYFVVEKDGEKLYENASTVASIQRGDQIKESAGEYYMYTATSVDKESWSCTTDKHAAGYKYTTQNDKTWYASKTDEAINNNNVFNVLVDGKIVKVKDQTDFVYGQHVLVIPKDGAKELAVGVYEGYCAACHKTLKYATTNISGAGALYDLDTAAWLTSNGTVAIPNGYKLMDKPVYVVGENTDKKDDTKKDGVDSAKTFDAGVAMYVGMSLLSVAGGAVVIGKKKEF